MMRQQVPLVFGWPSGATNPALAGPPTYHREVSRILQRSCQDCHRPDQVAPFSLLTYDQARKRADDLSKVTHDRTMPPWHASTTEGGPFQNPRVLPDADIAILAEWARAGAPEGDPKDAPPSPSNSPRTGSLASPTSSSPCPSRSSLARRGRRASGLRDPDRGCLKASGSPRSTTSPATPGSSHHALGAFDLKKRGRILDQADPRPGYKVFGGFGFMPDGLLSGWSPGHKATVSPEGVGRYLAPGADFLLQVHYHRSGKPEVDSTKVGIYFAKGPIDKEQRVAVVSPPPGRLFFVPDLRILAGSSHHEVTGTLTIEGSDRHLIGITPHMHWLGKDFLLTATMPDGMKRTLIKIDRWDFNWQDLYDLSEPIALPIGTRIDMVAHFDNSASNPSNPTKPPVNVGWGRADDRRDVPGLPLHDQGRPAPQGTRAREVPDPRFQVTSDPSGRHPMTRALASKRKDYGDFQTPPGLVDRVLDALERIGGRPTRVLEPTCGRGHFIAGLLGCPHSPREIIGLEIQPEHAEAARALESDSHPTRLVIETADLFGLDLRRDLVWAEAARCLWLATSPG